MYLLAVIFTFSIFLSLILAANGYMIFTAYHNDDKNCTIAERATIKPEGCTYNKVENAYNIIHCAEYVYHNILI